MLVRSILIFVALGAGHAFASGTVADCDVNDAPSAYSSASCDINGTDVCYFDATGTIIICDVGAVGCGHNINNTTAWAVEDFDSTGNHHFSVWGDCGTTGGFTDFCCTIDDDDSVVVKLQLYGTPYRDEPLSFHWDGTAQGGVVDDLAPHRAVDQFKGYIYGDEGHDVILGGDTNGNDYREQLYGEDGDDEMDGRDNGDYMSGGPGDDDMVGGGGGDHMDGGDGDDTISGETGNDAICDHSGTLGTCATPNGNVLSGGDQNDALWYGYDAACAGSTPFESCGAGGSDRWGDASKWGVGPADCEDNSLAARPTVCDDPG